MEEVLFEGNPTQLRMNKLNVYSRDMLSSPHGDTPDSEDVVGTLIAVLWKFPFSGGGIKLGESTIVGNSTFVKEPSRDFTLIAFGGGVPHSVEPVTEGHMATLTFDILKKGAWNTCLPITYQDVTNTQSVLFERALKDLLGLHDQFGILVGPQVAVDTTQHPLVSVMEQMKREFLLDMELHNVVVSHYEEIRPFWDHDEEKKVIKVFRCDSEDWNYLVGATSKKPPTRERIPIYHYRESYGDMLHEFEQDGWEDEEYGNLAGSKIAYKVCYSQVAIITRRC